MGSEGVGVILRLWHSVPVQKTCCLRGLVKYSPPSDQGPAARTPKDGSEPPWGV